MKNIFYRRNLPHIHPSDGIFFITFRLAGSLPRPVLESFKNEKADFIKKLSLKYSGKELKSKKYYAEKYYFSYFDDLLHKSQSSPQWLINRNIAHIVTYNIFMLHTIRYKLICHCIMPNHLHLLIDTTGFHSVSKTNKNGKSRNYPLADTMRLLKGRTARYANIVLRKQGAFWQHESYDHYIRDEHELNRIITYIMLNPVKAGLVEKWQDWPLNYLASG